MDNYSCESAKEIMNPIYRSLLIGEFVLASLSIPTNLLLLFIIWRVKIFCINLRFLLAHFSFALIAYAIGDMVKSSHLFHSVNNCSYQISIRDCKIFDIFCTGCVLTNILISFLTLCAHRLYATLKYRRYDKNTPNAPWSASALIIFSWIASIGVNLTDIQSLPIDQYVPICVNAFVPAPYSIIFSSHLIFEILATIIVIFSFFYTRFVAHNMVINRATFDLSSRFQVDQNVRINAIIIPSLILHVICHIPTFVLLTGLSGLWNIPFGRRPLLTRVTYIWRLLYSFLHPILAIWLNFNLKNHLLKISLVRKCLQNVKPSAKRENGLALQDFAAVAKVKQDNHFNYLETEWNDPKIKYKINKVAPSRNTVLVHNNCTAIVVTPI